MKKIQKLPVIFGSVCFILTIAVFVQIKTVNSITNDEGISLNDNAELKDEVLRWRQNNKDVYKQLEEVEARLEEVRNQAATSSEVDKEVENQIKRNNALLGLTEVKGSGAIIKLDENREEDPENIIDINSYLVHEGDLINIVNELYNAGADAISINGKRIVNTTSILCDGNIIRVNGEIVGVPIEIKAICYPHALYNLRRQGGYLSLMVSGGILVEMESSDNITIPKYDGVYKHDYISSNW